MVKLFDYSNKPVFIAVIICLIVLWKNNFSVRNYEPYSSLIPYEQINELQGQLLSSPVKTSSGKYYTASFRITNSKSTKGVKSKGSGVIKVFIPSTMVEAFYPGKLYSSSIKQGAFLWEQGGLYSVQGFSFSFGFFIENANEGNFSKNINGKIAYFRALCRLQFKRLMYSWGNAGGLLLALLCGSKEYTETSIINCFRNAGLSHILALSGMHLSMFSSLALFLGSKIGRKKITIVIRTIVLIIFVWFSGFTPSLLRAFICSMLLLLSSLSNVKEPDMFLILCFSFLVQLIFSPSDINNSGFILSYSALAGILLFNDFFRKIFSLFLPKYFSSSFGASTSAQVFTIPVSLKTFGMFCPIGIIATTIISPAITIFIYSGLFLIVSSLIFPVLSKPSGIFINFQYNIIKILATFFSQCPIIKI